MVMSILIYGGLNSIILALTALGFSLTIGISGVANLAHGGFYVFAGLLAWMLFDGLGLPYFVAVLLSVGATGLLGALMYWAVLLRVRGIVLSEVIATLAIGIGILEFFRWKGFVHYYGLPSFIEGSLEIAGVTIDYHRLAIIGIGLVLVVLLWLFTHHTKIGLAFRAIAQEEYTSLSFGIKSDWIAMLGVAFGSALAAIAAIAILPLGTISIGVGYEVLVIAMAVAVVGGLGSTLGTLVASLILGYAQVITATFLAPHWMMVVYLIAIIVVLAIKPSGLFGELKELEERV